MYLHGDEGFWGGLDHGHQLPGCFVLDHQTLAVLAVWIMADFVLLHSAHRTLHAFTHCTLSPTAIPKTTNTRQPQQQSCAAGSLALTLLQHPTPCAFWLLLRSQV